MRNAIPTRIIKKEVCLFFAGVLVLNIFSCKKLVNIDPPMNSIITERVFSDSANATAAVMGIYATIANPAGGEFIFLNGQTTQLGALSADELLNFNAGGSDPFSNNAILFDNSSLYRFWSKGYALIYQTNASIEGLNNTTTIDSNYKKLLLGEVRFIRALSYFYLLNYFGDVPYISSTDYVKETFVAREEISKIYTKIIDDLTFSYEHSRIDYSSTNGERIRVTKWAAASLLARVYLYLKDYDKALQYSNEVLAADGQLFSLVPVINEVFLANSNETILSLPRDSRVFPWNATAEGFQFIPRNQNAQPAYYLTDSLLKSFDSTDLRLNNWTNSNIVRGTRYFYPSKYKTGIGQAAAGNPPSEYFIILRVAELVLIRAEANLYKGDQAMALSDINQIRVRAGLSEIADVDGEQLNDLLIAERRRELFCEWGHRWLDLKRWGIANEVLAPLKSLWKPTATLFPIPMIEMQRNPALVQNPGYQ